MIAGNLFGSGTSPIGVDVGSRSIKMLQLNRARTEIVELARWDFSPTEQLAPGVSDERLAKSIEQLRETRNFRGRDAVLCLGRNQLYVQNLRVPKVAGESIDQLVAQEAEGRLPFPLAECDVRYVEAGDVRQGDVMRREVILLACHRPVLQRWLAIAENAGLRPVAIDVEPLAVLRSFGEHLRRNEDRQTANAFLHMGAANSAVVIARGSEPLFVKYVDIGGRQMDEAVARHLRIQPNEAVALRRNEGDSRAGDKDAELVRAVGEATRPLVDRLASELSMCIRYHSVTFRGGPLERMILGGGEATIELAGEIGRRIDLKCELGDPLRRFGRDHHAGRHGQWDVAAGLALRNSN